jgi:hypothetical protein
VRDTTEIIEYYKDLLLYQYVNLPKARATIGALVAASISDLIILDVNDGFNIETAVGAQLDMLGEFIGFSRRVYSELIRDWFEMVDSTAPVTTTGFTDYTDSTINPDSVFYRDLYAKGSVSDLTDEEYRYMLKLCVILNNNDNTLSSIQYLLFNFFGSDLLIYDSKDMTISYLANPDISRYTLLAITQELLPKPIGVTLSGVFELTDPAKSWGLNDYIYDNGNTASFSDYLTGFNGYYWLDYTNKL